MKLIKELLMSSNYWVLNKTIVKEFGIETAFLLSNRWYGWKHDRT